MRVGALVLALWYLLCGMALGAIAGDRLSHGWIAWGLIDFLLCMWAFANFYREVRRIDKE